MLDDPFTPLSFIAGPAILTNACAVLQNGATLRYNLAIGQWREFRASLAASDDRLARQYVDPRGAVGLAERRVRLQLRGLGLLSAAVGLFAATTILGLCGAVLAQAGLLAAAWVGLIMAGAGGGALVLLLAATVTALAEGACSRALLALHRDAIGLAASTRDSGRSDGHVL